MRARFEWDGVHEMVGVTLPMLMEAYHLYHVKLEEILSGAVLTDEERGVLVRGDHQRSQLDIEADKLPAAHDSMLRLGRCNPHWMMQSRGRATLPTCCAPVCRHLEIWMVFRPACSLVPMLMGRCR